MDAGLLDNRLSFYKRESVEDGAGNFDGDWVLQFTVAGNRKWLRGGESVMAARLSSRQPVILTIRNSTQARSITSDWKAIDRAGREYNIREMPKESDDRSTLEMLAESGVAV